MGHLQWRKYSRWHGDMSSMPFGGESTWDTRKIGGRQQCFQPVINAFRRGVHLGLRVRGFQKSVRSRHQCLSAGSPLGTHLQRLIRQLSMGSSMPFGGESTWDNETMAMKKDAEGKRHQCISAGSPLGTIKNGTNHAFGSGSSMPFGGESTWDAAPAARGALYLVTVINAFRRGVHLGHSQHQTGQQPLFSSVINAFRRGVHLGRINIVFIPETRPGHQCLSAGSPLGTLIDACYDAVVSLGHQCLSAGSPLGTHSRKLSRRYGNSVINAFRRGVHLGLRVF